MIKKCLFGCCIIVCCAMFFFCLVPVCGARLLFAEKDARVAFYLGDGIFWELPTASPKETLLRAKRAMLTKAIKGEEVRFSAGENFPREVISQYRAQVIKRERVGNTEIWYCTAKGLERFVQMPFGKVHMQIALTEGGATVGFPVIYGGF